MSQVLHQSCFLCSHFLCSLLVLSCWKLQHHKKIQKQQELWQWDTQTWDTLGRNIPTGESHHAGHFLRSQENIGNQSGVKFWKIMMFQFNVWTFTNSIIILVVLNPRRTHPAWTLTLWIHETSVNGFQIDMLCWGLVWLCGKSVAQPSRIVYFKMIQIWNRTNWISIFKFSSYSQFLLFT